MLHAVPTMGGTMFDWFVNTLRSYPEIAIFLSLSLGYCFGSFTYKGQGLGAVTATLISAVIIGQQGIPISPPLKATFFLMFLFAIAYGVGPQLVSGIAKDDVPQALIAAVVCVFCPMTAYLGAIFAGYDVGSAVGLYAGSQTISASMALATDATNRLGLPPDQTKTLLDAMPVADAVTYLFGTVGSAIVLALLGPASDRSRGGGEKEVGDPGTAWHHYELRAYRICEGGRINGKTCHAVDVAY
jgi:putative transport protein